MFGFVGIALILASKKSNRAPELSRIALVDGDADGYQGRIRDGSVAEHDGDAGGQAAAQSLNESGLFQKRWHEFNHFLRRGAYVEQTVLASGDVAEDIVGGNDANLFNWGAGEDKWVQGRVGGALDFGDADNYALTTSGIAQDRYTIAFWMNLQERSGVNPRIIAPPDGSSYILLNNESGEGIGQYFKANQLHDPNPPTLLNWEHYAVTYDHTTGQGQIYRDGVLIVSAGFSPDVPQLQWFLGHTPDAGNHNASLDGLLDDLRVYDVILSAEDVGELAAMGEDPPGGEGLIHHWTFDETSGDVATDVVGGNDIRLLSRL